MSHGQGKSYREDGSLEYDGQWEKDMVNGQGKYYRQDGILKYDGQWVNNVFKG